jgi:hypothetical protein
MPWSRFLYPPVPQIEPILACALGAVCIVVGAVLLVFGRLLSRGVMVAVGMLAGLLTGGRVAELVGLEPIVGQVALASALSVAGLVAAPLLWGVLLGVVVAVAAGIVLMAQTLPEAPKELEWFFPAEGQQKAMSVPQYARAVADVVGVCVRAVWAKKPGVLLVVTCGAGFVPMVFGLVRRRLAIIVMTSLLGTIGVCAGGVIIAVVTRGDLWSKLLPRYYIVCAVAAVVFVSGFLYQYYQAVRADGGPAAPARAGGRKKGRTNEDG